MNRQRFVPRGVARWWSVPLLRALGSATAPLARGGKRIDLGEASVYVYRPASPPARKLPALLWIHGGGLIIGDARQDEKLAQSFADRLGIMVASVQYRLAPKHPFPAPLDDCEAAYSWLIEQPDIDGRLVLVGGASAGGGLTAALCQRLRDKGMKLPAFQLLIYPMLDDRSAEGSSPIDPLFRAWDRRSNALGWASYLRGHDRARPPAHAIPGRTEDLSGLPPAWIGVGTLDLFHDEDLAYANRLRSAGVPVEIEVVEGAYHGFERLDPGANVSRAFRESQIAALSWSIQEGSR